MGCRGTELGIWDLATRQRSYLAKGAKPNRIGLVDPPCNTAVAFVPGSSATKVPPLRILATVESCSPKVSRAGPVAA